MNVPQRNKNSRRGKFNFVEFISLDINSAGNISIIKGKCTCAYVRVEIAELSLTVEIAEI